MKDDAAPAGQRPTDPADVVRRVVACFNAGEFDASLIAEDVVDHVAPPGTPPGPEGWRLKWEQMREGFSGLRSTVEESVVSGDMVCTRHTIRGTHTGEFMGVPGSGRTFQVLALDMLRVRGGQIVEHWAVNDVLSMLAQLGIGLPAPEGTRPG
ncbi:ester cyclase [Streptomyces sp. LN549]|uniref:ester cyclase n=1 Tax=Streptomyces sp. LN549 TaxID=3112979 RepID=UPI00371CA594